MRVVATLELTYELNGEDLEVPSDHVRRVLMKALESDLRRKGLLVLVDNKTSITLAIL